MNRKELLEEHRHINVDHDWWRDEYENFRDEMHRDYDVQVGLIYFSGFWSQGDGAQFEVRGWHSIWDLICRLGKQAEYAPWWESDNHVYKINIGSSRYSHSGYMSVEMSVECECGENADDVILEAFNRQYCAARSKQRGDLECEIIEFFRGKADELYRTLEGEYNYLTSDEVVWESIEASDLHLEDEDETL
jgi:hypothetical protein